MASPNDDSCRAENYRHGAGLCAAVGSQSLKRFTASVALAEFSDPGARSTELLLADGDASNAELTGYGARVHAAFLRELIYASSGAIAVDEVLDVREFLWHGYVFDFEASDGWIIADGMCISNCGCQSLPHRDAWTEAA
jgi:hypothetical protein